jgi:hypothetical protein
VEKGETSLDPRRKVTGARCPPSRVTAAFTESVENLHEGWPRMTAVLTGVGD